MSAPAPGGRAPKVGIVLVCGANEGGGGTGRRFGRLFGHLQRHARKSEPWLVTTPDFLDLMRDSNIEIDPERNVLFFEDEARHASSPAGRISAHRDYSRRLEALVARAGFDLVHFPMVSLSYAPFLLGRQPGLRRVFSMTAAVGAFDSLDWKAQLLYRLSFEACDAIDTLYTDVGPRFPAFAEKIRVSPCSFTDYSRYQPADSKERWIVFAGRLEEFKNPLLFVDAVARVARELRERGWKCLFFGKGELEAPVRARVSEHGLDDLIELDAVPDLSPFLNRSRIFISIQQSENYPSQVLLEAMAAGNAVIATDVGDTRKLVDEEIGVLVDRQTPDALARAIDELTGDEARCARLGERSRGRIVNEHNVGRFAEYLEEVWGEVLSGPSRRAPLLPLKLAALLPRLALGSKVA